ncbi:preprotein translocase subunit SecE [Aetokthonos hydrillicola Thurmond2011]|uniref:Protein translocase subunit SecE n=1 Tax=Aetokthonos hydrillicola Thurmond2011 TaxID=2712845 RepID=A0AAP5IFV2_9CYAN|nr:preprotein translocase subunit SecE [Aetokthonos hydrillicola]MDR9900971.1 preprotein translocase subunit SecE [Aetokthonos hydrillicola Thurmond2011]
MATAQAMSTELSEPKKPANWLDQSREYIQDLQKEMRMVSWPSREQVISTTAVVIGAIFAFALYFWIVDQAVYHAVKKLFDTLTK